MRGESGNQRLVHVWMTLSESKYKVIDQKFIWVIFLTHNATILPSIQETKALST